ncbi:uncharacterized protein VTP21DRAFT_5111 [Calcarisporiella thermophila]|uniref:uncharacterized protein n=1 Tax=Calcarisporiella thermophila TaxID=911321 RepID=UPI00374351A8
MSNPDSPGTYKSCLVKFFHLHPPDPIDRFTTSYWVRPYVLLITRTLSLSYALATFIGRFILLQNRLYSYIFYFTNLSYIGLLLYFMIAFILSVMYIRGSELQFLRGVWGLIVWIIYELFATFHLLVPIVFWAILFPAAFEEARDAKISPGYTWSTISVHALDLILLIPEVVLNRIPIAVAHMIFVVIILLLYMFETWIVHAQTGKWVYPFLNWDPPGRAAGYYLGVLVLTLLIFLVQYAVYRLKEWTARRIDSRKKEKNRARENGDVESNAMSELSPTLDSIEMKENHRGH